METAHLIAINYVLELMHRAHCADDQQAEKETPTEPEGSTWANGALAPCRETDE